MAFTRTWSAAYEALPADTDPASEGANRIRDLKTDIQERIEIDHSFAGDADDGKHKRVLFVDPLGTKPTLGASEGALYTKDVSSKAELFFEDEDGDEIQLTSGGLATMLAAVYDAAAVAEQLVGLTASQTLTNKTLTSPVLNTGVSGTAVLDEDDMASDSNTKLSTQQAIKAYVDDAIEVYTSSWYTITSGGLVSGSALSHGLSGAPQVLQHELKCVAVGGAAGYSQNDIINIDATQSGNQQGVSVTVTSSNLYIRYGADTTAMHTIRKDTGASVHLTNADWNYRVVALYIRP